MERFNEILTKLRISGAGKFVAGGSVSGGSNSRGSVSPGSVSRGSGELDLVMVSEDGSLLEIWRRGGSAQGLFSERGKYIRRIIFDEPDPVFDIDRLLTIIGSMFDARTATLTGDRLADGRYEMPDPGLYELEELLARDMDGDGVDEVVLVYEDPEDPEGKSFRVLKWR